MSDTVKSLKIRCAAIGTNLTEVCRRAGVTPATLNNWQKQEPKSFRILRDLNEALDKIEAEKDANFKAVPK